jgi:regulator of cell morphogenesis and NO signaling
MALHSTTILLAEHRQVEAVLSQLETVVDQFLTSPQVSAESQKDLHAMVKFLTADLTLHIRKEDEGLFPKLQILFPPGMGPLVVMDLEHREAEEALRGLAEGARRLAAEPASDGAAAARVRDCGRRLIRVLRSHLMKEEQVLFPMAAANLTAADDAEVVKKFEEISSSPVHAA